MLFQLHKLKMTLYNNFDSQIMNLENLNSRLSTQVNAAKSNIKKLEGRLSSTADSVNVMKKELVLTNNNLQADGK